ncbi:MAG: hypothetical protein R3Y09_07810 [Clostridia bacterium]
MIYICKNCGNIINTNDKDFNAIISRMFTCDCGGLISMDNSFPNLCSTDFIKTAEELFNQCKKVDKQNIKDFCSFLENKNITIDKTEIDSILNSYQNIKATYPDNDKNSFTSILDKFEKKLTEKYTPDQTNIIISSIHLFYSNKYRKLLIITIACIVEQLFSSYLKLLATSNLKKHGEVTFLKRIENNGTQSNIDISNIFLDEPLKNKMEKISNGFFDKWASLRNLRNDIIHSNEKYISKETISKQYKLIESSITVFSKLTSEVYR